MRELASREGQIAVGEARQYTNDSGFQDGSEAIMQRRRTWKTGMHAPILLTAEAHPSGLHFELFADWTGRGNLLGGLDRQEVPAYARGAMWIGRGG